MKVFFEKIYQLDPNYQDILIDENEFEKATYLSVPKTKQNINGVLYDDIYTLEPLSFYQIKLRKDTPGSFTLFYPSVRLLEAGLIVSNINKEKKYLFIYNSSHNHVFLKSTAIMGEIE